MTPREVDALTTTEFDEMADFMREEFRQKKRQQRKGRR